VVGSRSKSLIYYTYYDFPVLQALTANDIIYHIKQRVAYFAALFLCVAELQQTQCVLTLWFSDFSISVAF